MTVDVEVERGRRLERALVWVRWFGVAFGAYQVGQSGALPPTPPGYVEPVGYALVGSLAVVNVLVMLALRRADTPEGLRTLGRAVFFFDILALHGLIWAYSYSATDTTWVLLYILPLEGALRYGMRGALASLAVAIVSESFREWFLTTQVPDYAYHVELVTFRVGIDAVIALVAGYMADSWIREARNAAARAEQAEEAVSREAAARRELSTLQRTVLAGVAAQDLEESLQSMAETISRDMDFESLCIALVEEDRLVPKAAYGFPESAMELRVEKGKGVTGEVWATAKPILVEDIRQRTNYISAAPGAVGEMCAPLIVGGEVLGVVDVESWERGRLTASSLELLTRLADQMALVVGSARSLHQQRQLVARLQELDEMKSDFVAITSHEVRTPLTAIRGYVQTLRRHADKLSEKQVHDFLEIIDHQSDRLSRLVEDLLVVSRIEAGQVRLELETVEIGPFVRRIGDAFAPVAKGRLVVDVPADGVVAEFDPHRCDQILRNLIQNALKFSEPPTPVVVTARLQPDQLEFLVADHGVGIPETELDQVFDRFYQAESALTRRREGAGLGLYITKRLTEAMGGRIEVRSALGEGSTFRIILPQTPLTGSVRRSEADSSERKAS